VTRRATDPGASAAPGSRPAARSSSPDSSPGGTAAPSSSLDSNPGAGGTARGRRPILILGGTAEARELAADLHAAGLPVVSSLAGRLEAPRRPPGEVRTGGFGGADGLARWLEERGCAAVVDATHPFAARMAAAAPAACARAAVPLLRLERPGWTEQPGDRWHWVPDVPAAAHAVPTHGRRVLLALGGRHIAAFADVRDVWFLIRAVETPPPPLPPHHELLLDRGPYTLPGERALIEDHAIDALVTRDSGGEATAAKLTAARRRSLPVILIRRPPRPRMPTVATVADAAAWARGTRRA
jgi:precorrin-6A/cobalt-precorrin-6A reductase